jgi:hypothetical protein
VTTPRTGDELPHVWVRLEGSPRNDGKVRARDFVEFFEALLRVLRGIEKGTGSAPQTVAYTIVDMSVSSAVMELEAESPDETSYLAREVVKRFGEGLQALERGSLGTIDFDEDVVRGFAKLMAPLGQNLPSITVRAGTTEVVLTGNDMEEFALVSERETFEVGSFTGFIDAINVHTEPVFFLYPPVGPTRIPCEFDRTMLDEVRNALKRYVTVHGLFTYRPGFAFPSRITIERIEVNPPEDELPTLSSLRGIAPDLTGGLDAVTFVRQIRDAEA